MTGMSVQSPTAQRPGRRHHPSPWRVREPRAATLTELTTLVAVLTILITRAYLAATGWPQVGGGTLHIAHMLWGGLLMTIGWGMLLQTADRVWKPASVVVFGIGLGLFIDEIGKFITKSHDYFYEPAVAVMYVFFVVVLLTTRLLERLDTTVPADHVYLATRAVQHLSLGRLGEAERLEALAHLDRSGLDDEVTRAVRALLEGHQGIGGRRFDLVRAWDDAMNRIRAVVGAPVVMRAVVWLFVVGAVLTGAMAAVASGFDRPNGVGGWLSLLWQVAAGVLTGVGLVAWWRGRRLRALEMFHAATLLALLFGQVYTFAESQLWGLLNLIGDLAVLAALRVFIEAETRREPGAVAGPQS